MKTGEVVVLALIIICLAVIFIPPEPVQTVKINTKPADLIKEVGYIELFDGGYRMYAHLDIQYKSGCDRFEIPFKGIHDEMVRMFEKKYGIKAESAARLTFKPGMDWSYYEILIYPERAPNAYSNK